MDMSTAPVAATLPLIVHPPLASMSPPTVMLPGISDWHTNVACGTTIESRRPGARVLTSWVKVTSFVPKNTMSPSDAGVGV